MPYHVYIQLDEPNEKWRLVKRDVREEAVLRKSFVKPYLKGKNLLLDAGQVVAANQIRRVRIMLTADPIQDELLRENERVYARNKQLNDSQDGFLIVTMNKSADEISYVGTDLTNRYITAAPGSGGVLSGIFKSDWTVQIVGGLILLVVSTFVALYFKTG